MPKKQIQDDIEMGTFQNNTDLGHDETMHLVGRLGHDRSINALDEETKQIGHDESNLETVVSDHGGPELTPTGLHFMRDSSQG